MALRFSICSQFSDDLSITRNGTNAVYDTEILRYMTIVSITEDWLSWSHRWLRIYENMAEKSKVDMKQRFTELLEECADIRKGIFGRCNTYFFIVHNIDQ